MKITVCIGSSCHLKGSRLIVEQLQELIKENALEDKIELVGTFCLGECQSGVSIKIDDTLFPSPQRTQRAFSRRKPSQDFNLTLWQHCTKLSAELLHI